MKLVVALVPIALGVSSCAGSPVRDEPIEPVAFGCDDQVVVARVGPGGDYEHVEIDGDILGHGWITTQARVRKVLKGADVPSRMTVRYFDHTYLRRDRDFMLVLRRGDGDIYEVQRWRLMSRRPKLAARCDGGSAGD